MFLIFLTRKRFYILILSYPGYSSIFTIIIIVNRLIVPHFGKWGLDLQERVALLDLWSQVHFLASVKLKNLFQQYFLLGRHCTDDRQVSAAVHPLYLYAPR